MNTGRDYILMACIWLFFIAFILAGILYVRRSWRKRAENIATLKAAYNQALKAKDKQVALTAGRIYYSAIRNGKFTTRDEQAIANDLAVL